MVHEFGHNIGLNHSWSDDIKDDDDGKNYMDYTNGRGGFSGDQLTTSFGMYNSGKLNQGSGFQKAANDIYTLGQTTNDEPYRTVRAGQRIPTVVKNQRK